MTGKRFQCFKVFVPVCLLTIFLFVQAFSLTLKPNVLFNLNWKFAKGAQNGAQATTFDDASWEKVNVPHSASYDAPNATAELKHYQGDSWYRKTFTCPAEAQKVLLNFEGAMQTTTLYINGTQVGVHDRSGFTAFSFDISSYVKKGESNLVAIKLNVVYSLDIPPGGTGTSGAPDFLLFSGLYRNVWLQFKDSVYIPNRGQQITTPGTTSKAGLRAVTNVRNESKTTQSVTVDLSLYNKVGESVIKKSVTQSVNSNSSYKFDMLTDSIAPQLWSPTSPYLYSLITLVKVGSMVVDSTVEKVGSMVVDSTVEKVGFRFYAWNSSNGFLLNGSRLSIKGVCQAQYLGWVENAVPDSRFAQQVVQMKEMGVNSIRCSHYPRAQAFYRACDSLGMLVYVEVPTWGVSGGFLGKTTFWNRVYSCDTAMVLDGFNHPCVYVWGLFNEPNEEMGTEFGKENDIIHNLDPVSGSGRVTAIASYAGGKQWTILDVVGINYQSSSTVSNPILNTEQYGQGGTSGDWHRLYSRGSAMDLDVGTSSEAANQVKVMNNTLAAAPRLAGAHFWCYADYNSWRNSDGFQGLVDRLYIPKGAYFMFKKSWANGATDYPISGTATKIDLTADIKTLKADGSDLSLLVANLRDATGNCINQAGSVTFKVDGPGTLFPGTGTSYNVASASVTIAGGRAGTLLRTTTTPGTITVTATSNNGFVATQTFTSTPVTEEYTIGNTPVLALENYVQQKALHFQIITSGKGFTFKCPSSANGRLSIVNLQGKTLLTYAVKKGASVFIGNKSRGAGVFYGVWENGSQRLVSRMVTVH